MEPIVLIHGFSAESSDSDLQSIKAIYGTLPDDLRKRFGNRSVVEIDLARYLSMDDGLGIGDFSMALDRALNSDFKSLLATRFNAIVHSTGALVIRNWVRRTWNTDPGFVCPAKRIVYLAGANLGSGLAHVGRTQLAKWYRLLFQGIAGRGLATLEALELGSDWTLTLHLDLLHYKINDKVMEFCLIGSQPPKEWFLIPIRYTKEDGSDGVVRVSASNLNFNYLRIEPTDRARKLSSSDVQRFAQASRCSEGDSVKGLDEGLYAIAEPSCPGFDGRAEVPFAVVYGCSHSGDKTGIVSGTDTREQVMGLLTASLGAEMPDIANVKATFDSRTQDTYEMARTAGPTRNKLIGKINVQKQYDKHSQVIFRIKDQFGRPVQHFGIYFNSLGGGTPLRSIDGLFEDSHANEISPNIITFYLRSDSYNPASAGGSWVPSLPFVNGCTMEIDAHEPLTERVQFLPLHLTLSASDLERWVQPHRTTIVDVALLRTPVQEVLSLTRLP